MLGHYTLFFTVFELICRYEDLSMEPYETVDKMIDFLNLPQQRQFLDPYLVTHTGVKRSDTDTMPEKQPPNKNDGPYGTKRKSSEATAFKWAHTMVKDWIEEIEDACEKPMEALGYSKFVSDTTKDQDFLTKTSDEVWPYFPTNNQQP